MRYQKRNKKQEADRIKNPHSAGLQKTEESLFPLPNSVMWELLDPGAIAAEKEADRLSDGITSGSFDSVREQMGSRLHSDLSSVRYHTGPESIRKGGAIDARAWTRGSDIYFGKGGYDASVAAHELVHTVQQGAVEGTVSHPVPAGTVQKFTLFGKKFGRDKEKPDLDYLADLYKQRLRESHSPGSISDPGDSGNVNVQQNGSEQQNVQETSGTNMTGGSDQENQLPENVQNEVLNETPAENQSNGSQMESSLLNDLQLDPFRNNLNSIRNNNETNEIANNSWNSTPADNPSNEIALNPRQNGADQQSGKETSGTNMTGDNGQENQLSQNPQGSGGNTGESPSMTNSDLTGERPLPEDFPERREGEVPDGSAPLHNNNTDQGYDESGELLRSAKTGADIFAKTVHSLSCAGVLGEAGYNAGVRKYNKKHDASKAKSESSFMFSKASPAADFGTDLIGLGSGLVNTASGVKSIYKNVKNTGGKGKRWWDVLHSTVDTGISAASATSSFFSMAKSGGKIFGGTAGRDFTHIAKLPGAKFLPGLGIATGAAVALNGLWKTLQGVHSKNKIKGRLRKLKNLMADGNVVTTESQRKDQEKLKRIFKQGKRLAEFNRAGGIFDMISGALTAASGAMSLGGPLGAVASGALGLASGAVGLVRHFYEYRKKKKHVNDVVAEELGIGKNGWDEKIKEVRDVLGDDAKGLSDKDIREIILKANGFIEKTRHEAFNRIRMERADFLLKKAKDQFEGNQEAKWARRVIRAIGIDVTAPGFNFDDPDVKKLLAEKLG